MLSDIVTKKSAKTMNGIVLRSAVCLLFGYVLLHGINGWFLFLLY